MSKNPWLRLLLGSVAVTSLVFAAACGDDDDDDDNGNGNGNGDQVEDCTPAEEAVVDQDNLRFIPNELCVSAGTEVLFLNSETAVHTVTVDGENLSGTMRQNDEFRWTPESTGTYEITCDFHPQMRAEITVVE